MKELIIENDYTIKVEKIEINKLKVRNEDKKKFNSLGVKSKLARLSYLKKVAASESELISIVSQSRYLRLLKDSNGFHIRYQEDLEDIELLLESKIMEFIKIDYGILIDEEVNSGMSGDINRVEISKGSLLE